MDKIVRIGGACGYWGETAAAVPQLLAAGGLDFIVFDYLAEITMSIMARARARDPALGYAGDFVHAALKPNLAEIARQGVHIISNAGGVNPRGCADAIRRLVMESGLNLKVAVITGDDLIENGKAYAAAGVRELFSDTPFPPVETIASINAYLGAFPIAAALNAGADIVITGRVVDSAVTLGACIHAFCWGPTELHRLAGASLAGHILECSTQASGGNFTDWEEVSDSLADLGYPIAEVADDGSFVCTKPAGTGGTVSVATVSEQMLYEIEDPQSYMLPDVVCDFSQVNLQQLGPDRVSVSGARGEPPSGSLKVSATWHDGFRAGQLLIFYGTEAARKARAAAEAILARTTRALERAALEPLSDSLVEVIGDESHYGAFRQVDESREVVLKIAAKHRRVEGVAMLLRELSGMGLSAPPGLTTFSAAGRPKPSPLVRLFSFLVPQVQVPIEISMDGSTLAFQGVTPQTRPTQAPERPQPPATPDIDEPLTAVPLIWLAWGRSGDKGNRANIGIIARRPEYLSWIWRSLSEEVVAERFAHFLQGRVERYLLPGPHAINFVLHDVLGGGGVASLRNDPQGKGYAQLLLDAPVAVPASLAEAL